eukprot:UN01773
MVGTVNRMYIQVKVEMYNIHWHYQNAVLQDDSHARQHMQRCCTFTVDTYIVTDHEVAQSYPSTRELKNMNLNLKIRWLQRETERKI